MLHRWKSWGRVLSMTVQATVLQGKDLVLETPTREAARSPGEAAVGQPGQPLRR